MRVNLTQLRNSSTTTTIATWERFGEERGTVVFHGPTTNLREQNFLNTRGTLDFLCTFFPQDTEFYSNPIDPVAEWYINKRSEDGDRQTFPVTQAKRITGITRGARARRGLVDFYEQGLSMAVGTAITPLEPSTGAYSVDDIIVASPLSGWRPINLVRAPREDPKPSLEDTIEEAHRAGNKLGKMFENWGTDLPPVEISTYDFLTLKHYLELNGIHQVVERTYGPLREDEMTCLQVSALAKLPNPPEPANPYSNTLSWE